LRAPLAAALAFAALAAGSAQAAKARPHIDGFEAALAADGVRVSFRVADAVAEEILERIRSGIPVVFKHKIEVLGRRSVPLWPTARVVGRMRVETQVTYDSLNHTYDLVRTVAQRHPDPAPEPAEESRSTESLEQALVWLTEIEGLPPVEIGEGAGEEKLRVRVESTLGRRWVWYLFYARFTVSAERNLED
jgi:hypothetical protein